MKYSVTVSGRTYQVEIEDLNTRPILASVDGEVFEVFPEELAKPSTSQPKPVGNKRQVEPTPVESAAKTDRNSNESSLVAPLPGNITEIFVKPGDLVESGQVLLIIEAMKMKNSIRSTRSGKVASVLVSAGQTIAHKQALVEFEE